MVMVRIVHRFCHWLEIKPRKILRYRDVPVKGELLCLLREPGTSMR